MAARLATHSSPTPAPQDISAPPRTSYEVSVTVAPPHGPVRIRKKPSVVQDHATAARPASLLESSSHDPARPEQRAATAPGKAVRKSSIRSAVRRMFGGKEFTSGGLQAAPVNPAMAAAKHSQAVSDPGFLHTIVEAHPATPSVSGDPQRTVSAPMEPLDSPSPRKARSSNAVEFPQSARLKPLDLGNPFYARLPRRRASLPSMVLDEKEESLLEDMLRTKGVTPADGGSMAAEGPIGVAITTPNKKHDRRSRSVDDLRRMIYSLPPTRAREEEITFWRQSFAGSVLQHETFHSAQDDPPADYTHDAYYDPSQPGPEAEESQTADNIEERQQDEKPHSPKVGSSLRRSDSPLDTSPFTDSGVRMSRVENSLARLEMGLARLTAQSSDRGSGAHDVSYLHDSSRHTSPVRLSADSLADHRHAREHSAVHTIVPDRVSQDHHASGFSQYAHSTHVQNYAALYSMIQRERTARRALQEQVEALQQSLADVQYQLSQPLIQRPLGPMYQSLADHPLQYETHVPNYSHVMGGPHDHLANPRLTSRFSLSESITDSEAARLRESPETEADKARRTFDIYGYQGLEGAGPHRSPVEGAMF